MWSAFLGGVNITGDIKNFVQILILLNKTKIVEIFISRVILKAEKKRTTVWKWQDIGVFWLLY